MFHKIFTAEQIKQIDLQSIQLQKITSEELMERAATQLFKKMVKRINPQTEIFIFCGVGNNGGDGLVLARLFHQHNYEVNCLIVPFSNKTSPDFDVNLHRLMSLDIEVTIFDNNIKKIPRKAVIIDAIFGTGLTRPATGIAQKATALMNKSKAEVLSVDMPSGLYVDFSNSSTDTVVESDMVYTFQSAKKSFFYVGNASKVKDFTVVNIGLSKSVMKQMPTNILYVTNQVTKMLKKRDKFAYKNTFGHALLVGGSYGMTGAMILSSRAALRIGAGLVSSFVPKSAYRIIQTAVPEAMTLTDKHAKRLTKINPEKQFDAIGIGQGMGTHKDTVKAFAKFLKKIKKPMIIDADALNILAKHKKLLADIPKNSILTPHIGEFKRLAGTWQNEDEKWQKLLAFAKQNKVIVVLKGAYTLISDGEFIYINPVANSALATAGSGDVLTGIMTGLLAQGYQAMEVALLGVYLHSKTAEKYIKKKQAYTMLASDIIEML